MQKNTYFHNYKFISENKDEKKIIPTQYVEHKRVVDINKLFNRVRLNKKNENKKKIIFYCSTILSLGFFSTLIMSIK